MQTSKFITKDNTNYYIQSFHLVTSRLWCCAAFNNSIKEKLESIQYNVCLALTAAKSGLSKEIIYQELGLQSLRDRRWCRKFCLVYKVMENENLKYLFSLTEWNNLDPHLQRALWFLKAIFLSSYDYLETLEFFLLQDLDLA